MKKIVLVTLLLTGYLSVTAQKNIHPQEPIHVHYKTLGELSAKPSPEFAWMDTISYPPKEFGSSLTFVLVKPYYLSDSQVKSLTTSVKPPANSSEQTRKELEYLLSLQASRTPKQIERVKFLANIGFWPQTHLIPTHPNYQQNLKDLFFEGNTIMGDWCNAQNFPAIAKVLAGAMQDMRVMEFTIKYTYFRPRPYHLEKKLESLDRIGSPSFASGHTLWAFIQAYIWSEIIPEKRNEFIALAEEIRQSRELMGIHYPSDNEAARQITYQMLIQYMKNPDFINDFGLAKKEWVNQSKKYFTK